MCIFWRELTGASKIQCQSPSRWLIELRQSHQDIRLDFSHSMVRHCLCAYKNLYICSAVWNVELPLAMVSLNIYKPRQMNKRRKVWQKKTGLRLKKETEDQGQSSPKSIGTLTMRRCLFGPNLEILTSNGGGLSRRQAQNGVNFDFESNLTLKVKVNRPLKLQGSRPRSFTSLVPIFVILA